MCDCQLTTHPGIMCGAEGCKCHDEESTEELIVTGTIPILVAEDKEVIGQAVALKRGDRVVITIELSDNSAEEIVNLMSTDEADKLSWTLRMFEGTDQTKDVNEVGE